MGDKVISLWLVLDNLIARKVVYFHTRDLNNLNWIFVFSSRVWKIAHKFEEILSVEQQSQHDHISWSEMLSVLNAAANILVVYIMATSLSLVMILDFWTIRLPSSRCNLCTGNFRLYRMQVTAYR